VLFELLYVQLVVSWILKRAMPMINDLLDRQRSDVTFCLKQEEFQLGRYII